MPDVHDSPTFDPPAILALRRRLAAATTALDAVARAATDAQAKPASCATRGLVSARLLLGIVREVGA